MSIEVTRGSGPLTMDVGGETYGSKDRYVRYNDAIYLIDDATLRPLQYAASRLVERNLFPFKEADIEGVNVDLPDGTAHAFVQQNRDDRTKAYWARADALEEEDEIAGTWLGKVFKLRLRKYVDESEIEGTLTPVMTYSVSGKGERWSVEILKVDDGGTDLVEEGGIVPAAPKKDTWYARTAYNRSLVSLTESLVQDFVDDLDSLNPE